MLERARLLGTTVRREYSVHVIEVIRSLYNETKIQIDTNKASESIKTSKELGKAAVFHYFI